MSSDFEERPRLAGETPLDNELIRRVACQELGRTDLVGLSLAPRPAVAAAQPEV
jgi:hypothetical protein